ncbi:uncharacterized protein CCOS01_16825 [Colletotrichum costaricense]|uniref:Xylanolytic transcriptional activator regulatory domain-containing protein n=1 Tax=Colletotrichum costaricense TaxID=1209916 RepID=A0AAJ0DS27_9PEZI|nr:uncharacterized protein CCOS01_16825 [Colletotrichum costaricense]KAK1504373.1 hypothetical protein CCOS01_16825 [Colletotrichum costaricense]
MPSEEAKSLTRILNTLGLPTTQLAIERNKTPPIDPALSLEPQTSAVCVPSNNTILPPDQLPLGFPLPFDPSSFNLGNDATVGLAPPVQDGLLNLTTRAIADWEWSPSENADNIITNGGGIASVQTPSHPLLSTYSGEAALSDNEEDDAGSGTTEEDLVNQLSDRLGSLQIGPNGKISYFGPTSNFSLMELPVGADTLAVDRTVRNDGQEHLDNMGYGKQVPQDLEDHLINLYFTWQDPFQHVVDRTLYDEAKHSWHEREEDTPYYSEALRNAMCSLGATFETRYHPSFITFPKSLPDFFAARAKTLLEIELDSPSVSTVQAMIVLSSHEIGANRDSRAMAIRLAFDLALHKDMTPYVNKGVLKPAEAELRRAVFWSAYTMDQTLGFYRGRPFRISMDDITVGKPTEDSSDGRIEQWLPYVSRLSNDNAPVPIQDYTEVISLYRIELCEIMAPLGHTLYGNSRIPRDILQANNEKIVSILFAWKQNLPRTIQVDLEDSEGTFLPHVLLLQPWMSSSYIQPQPPQGPGYMHAQQMCIESAAAVAKLILIYERQYSLKRVHIQGVAIIFSAAIILIFASISRRRRKRTTETATHLSVCFRALEELSGTWECAKRSRDFLLMLQPEQAEFQSLANLTSAPQHTNSHSCKITMSLSDDRLCRNCTKLNLQAVFDPARFDGLPAIGSAQSYKTSWTKYIQHVGDWRPLTREDRISQYPPGIIPSCPFCDLVFSIGFNLNRYPMAEKEKIMLAIPANLLYNFAEKPKLGDGGERPDFNSVLLLVMNPSHYKTASAQYFGNTSAGGGLTAWIRFAHREAPGSLVSLASTAILEPTRPLLDLPMQARVLREERIDYGLVRSWIHLCENHHDACRTSPDWQTLPHFKLIDCETRQIINTDPATRYRYVALSYVWGVAPPDRYTYPCLPDDLPPVIQDAMRATIKLGFRYIWIDRYCIWQDDATHKMSQVERMDQIYGDAELSIIAIGAKDPSYGLPGLSLGRTQHVPITKTIGEQGIVTNFSHQWQLDQISRSKWSTRGWTFQETCLSRRRLYFSNYEVSFECHDMMCFEHLTRPLALQGNLEHHERPEWTLLNTPDGIWAILQKYCDRQLTYSSDRLAAVSGVLKKWSRVNPGCFSYWGIPIVASGWLVVDATASRRAFLAGLQWEIRPEGKNYARLAGFPSWSWVSQNGKTLFGHYGYFHLRPPKLVELTENFDSEVWVETPQGNMVEWADFFETSGLDSSIMQCTRYLHIECWSFQTGPLCYRKIKRRSGTSHDDMFYLPTTRKPSDGKGEFVIKFTPDFGYEDTFLDRKLTAICFSPLEHATCAIVLESVPGLTPSIRSAEASFPVGISIG